MTLINGTDASPASEIDKTLDGNQVTDAAPIVEDAKPAPSSSADSQDAKDEPRSLLDVVKRVTEKKPEATEASSTPEARSEQDPEADPAKGDGLETDNAEGKPEAELPFHNHPRFKELVQERNTYKTGADSFRQITEYMDQTGLTGGEVAEGFAIMGLLKSGETANLQKARDWFAERLQGLDEHLGITLPADLREKVEDGLVDEDVAKELARTRAEKALLENRTELQRQSDDEARQKSEAQATVSQMAAAVQQWESGIKAKDPDYAAKKAELVETQVRSLIQQRGAPPRNADEALELVRTAYGKINEILKPLVAKPRPVTPSPTGMSAPASPAPASLRAAIDAALQR